MKTEERLELDIFTAEHVMGWKRIDPQSKGWRPQPDIVWDTGNEDNPTCLAFHPTIYPDQAMMVLEACAKKVECIEIYGPTEGSPSWVVDESYRMYKPGTELAADTLPEAICLFAKALFGKEKP